MIAHYLQMPPVCEAAAVEITVTRAIAEAATGARAGTAAGAAVSGAMVSIGTVSARTATDGRATLPAIPAGEVELQVDPPAGARLASRRLTLRVCGPERLRVYVRLASHAVQLDQFVVTATEVARSTEGASVTRVGRDAIEHVQASSLADVLQLVPGQAAVNPTLSAPRQVLLRQSPTSLSGDPGAGVEAERANALGTSVVLDGVPLSNNANLQTTLTILNSGPNALPAFASTAGRGLDLRQVGADQIESVEIVRGVPSARHGDLTSGAILVTSRAGARAPEIRLRANPQTFELSTVAGWGRAATHGLSLDANLVGSQDDPRSTLDAFTRANVQAAYSRERDRLGLHLRARAYGVVDQARRDPDDLRYQREVSSRDDGARLDLRIRLGALRGWHTELTASGTAGTQRSRYQELVTRDIFPVAFANRDTLAPGVYGRSEYLARLSVDGRPRQLYSRLESRGTTTWRGARFDPVVGMELRHEANAGAGRLFDPVEPPRQNYGVGDRPRSFDSIPSLTQLAAYAEQRVRVLVRHRALDVSAGVRLDAVDPAGHGAVHGAQLAPRLAMTLSMTSALTARASHGVMSKAPTLSQLYPAPRYFDLTSFNYYPTAPVERLVLFTTKVVDPRDDHLSSSRATKSEVALDYIRARTQATWSFFREHTVGAFGTSRMPIGIAVPQYRAASFPAGQPPILEPTPFRVDSFVGLYDTPRNSRRITTDGSELSVDLPTWQRLRTQLSVTGGWYRTVATDEQVDIPVDQFISGSVQPTRVGVYAGGRGVEAIRGITSARLVHRAPMLGLAASLLWQVIWQEDDRPVGATDGVPLGFVDRSAHITWLSRDEALLPAYASLVRAVTPLETRWERRPALHLVNLRLTKSLPGQAQLSLFANNALADRPLYRRQRQPGFERRNQPAFFGVEFLATLPHLRSNS